MVRAQFGPTVEGDVGCSGGTPSFLGSYGNQRALELCDASGDGEHHAPGQRRRRPRVSQQIEVQRFSPRSSLRCAHTQVAERHAAGFTALAYVSRPFLSHARSEMGTRRFVEAMTSDALAHRGELRENVPAATLDERIAALPEPWRTRTRHELEILNDRIMKPIERDRARAQ